MPPPPAPGRRRSSALPADPAPVTQNNAVRSPRAAFFLSLALYSFLTRLSPNPSRTKNGLYGQKCSRAPILTPSQEQKRPLTPQIAREHFGKHYTNTQKRPPARQSVCPSGHSPSFGHQNRLFRAQVANFASLDTRTAVLVLKWLAGGAFRGGAGRLLAGDFVLVKSYLVEVCDEF